MSRSYRLFELSGSNRLVRVAPSALASGGDGAIYLVKGEPELVAKIYHNPGKDPDRQRKVRAMLSDPPLLPPIEVNGFHYTQMAWPEGWLEAQGEFVGYVRCRW